MNSHCASTLRRRLRLSLFQLIVTASLHTISPALFAFISTSDGWYRLIIQESPGVGARSGTHGASATGKRAQAAVAALRSRTYQPQ
jgi:hypothetical protein